MAGEAELLAEVGEIMDDEGALLLFEQAVPVLASVDALLDRTEAVKRLRNGKGKRLSPESVELLWRLYGRLAELADTLDPDGEHNPERRG